MIGEVKRLHESGVSFERLESFGLEYRFVSLFLQNKISEQQLIDRLFTALFASFPRDKCLGLEDGKKWELRLFGWKIKMKQLRSVFLP